MGCVNEKLGPPNIEIEGLQIWIHGRQFPDNHDYWDGNWLYTTAHCAAIGASVWVSGSIIMVPEIVNWMMSSKTLYQNGEGEAVLETTEPYLYVQIKTADKIGHLVMRVEITPDHLTQKHSYEFSIDQSYLPALIAQCEKIIDLYPVRGR